LRGGKQRKEAFKASSTRYQKDGKVFYGHPIVLEYWRYKN